MLNGQLLSALPWSFPSPQHGVWGFWKFLHHVPYVLELSPRYRKCPGLCYLFILWQGSWLPRQHLLLQSTQFQIWPVLVSSGDGDGVLISRLAACSGRGSGSASASCWLFLQFLWNRREEGAAHRKVLLTSAQARAQAAPACSSAEHSPGLLPPFSVTVSCRRGLLSLSFFPQWVTLKELQPAILPGSMAATFNVSNNCPFS